MRDYWWAIALGAGGVVLVPSRTSSVPYGSTRIDRTVLKIPVIGDILDKPP